MENCKEIQALLDAYADGELSVEEAARVRTHLDSCPACRAYVDDALAIRAALGGWEDTAVPEDFSRRVMAAVAAHPRRRPTPWRKAVLPLAACFAVAMLALPLRGYLTGQSDAPAQAVTAQIPASQDAPAEAAPAQEAAPSGTDAAAAGTEPAEKALAEEETGTAAENDAAAPPSARIAPENAPEETAEAEPAANAAAEAPAAAEASAVPSPYLTADTPTVHASSAGTAADEAPFAALTLTRAQAGDLLADYTPEETADGRLVYRLDSAAYVQLKCALIATGSLPDTEELTDGGSSEAPFALVTVLP